MYGFDNIESIEKDSELHCKLVKKCQDNVWIKERGAAFGDDPFLELDSPYSFCKTDDIESLKKHFEHGNWAIRNGIVYKDLVFVNQVDGGDEWWTLKLDPETNEYVGFESVSFRTIIKSGEGEFEKYIDRLEKATIEQCLNLNY